MMSKRNSREAKARRRAEREAVPHPLGVPVEKYEEVLGEALATVQQYEDVFGDTASPFNSTSTFLLSGAAKRGETLPCGCDAHQLLHSDGWEVVGDEDG